MAHPLIIILRALVSTGPSLTYKGILARPSPIPSDFPWGFLVHLESTSRGKVGAAGSQWVNMMVSYNLLASAVNLKHQGHLETEEPESHIHLHNQ